MRIQELPLILTIPYRLETCHSRHADTQKYHPPIWTSSIQSTSIIQFQFRGTETSCCQGASIHQRWQEMAHCKSSEMNDNANPCSFSSFSFQEYQKSNPNLLVDNAEMNNVVYVFKSENSTITVKGKINSIFLDSCKKCSVLFDSVVSSIEFVNCQSVQMQVS